MRSSVMRLAHQTLLPVHESARRTPRLQAKLLLLRTNPLARRSVLQAKGMIAPFVMRTCIMNPPTTSIGVRDVEIQSIRHALRPVRRNVCSFRHIINSELHHRGRTKEEGRSTGYMCMVSSALDRSWTQGFWKWSGPYK